MNLKPFTSPRCVPMFEGDAPRPIVPVRRSRAGFTLIELLVVIAIIAILAAILFPVFAAARSKARQTSCLSDLKQIGTAMLQYSQDFDEAMVNHYYRDANFPFAGGVTYPPGAASTNYKWMDAIQPYVKNTAIFNCPEQGTSDYLDPATIRSGDTTTKYGPYIPQSQITAISRNYGSYCMNSAYYGLHNNGVPGNPPVSMDSPPKFWNLAQLQAPSTTIWVGDGDGESAIDGTSTLNLPGQFAYDAPPIEKWHSIPKLGNFVARHQGKCDILWCDGHVKPVSLDALIDDNTQKTDAYKNGQTGGLKVYQYFTIEADPN